MSVKNNNVSITGKVCVFRDLFRRSYVMSPGLDFKPRARASPFVTSVSACLCVRIYQKYIYYSLHLTKTLERD